MSCTHTTVIKALDSKGSVDPAVSVYVDGQFLGKGEVVYSDQKTSLSAIPIYELKKETCPNVRETLRKKTDWINALGGSFIAGAGLGIMNGLDRIGKPGAGLLYGTPITVLGIVLTLWSRDYAPLHEQEFQCFRLNQGA